MYFEWWLAPIHERLEPWTHGRPGLRQVVLKFVLCAADEKQAREMASERAGEEGGAAWLDQALSTCKSIDPACPSYWSVKNVLDPTACVDELWENERMSQDDVDCLSNAAAFGDQCEEGFGIIEWLDHVAQGGDPPSGEDQPTPTIAKLAAILSGVLYRFRHPEALGGMNTNACPPRLLDSADAGRILCLTSGQVLRLARKGKLPSLTLPKGEVRFVGEDLTEWIDKQRQAARKLELCES